MKKATLSQSATGDFCPPQNQSRREHCFLHRQKGPPPCKRCCFGRACLALLCGSAPAENHALLSALFAKRSPQLPPCSCSFSSAVLSLPVAVLVTDLPSKALWTACKKDMRAFYFSTSRLFRRFSSAFRDACTAAAFAASCARCRSLSVKH